MVLILEVSSPLLKLVFFFMEDILLFNQYRSATHPVVNYCTNTRIEIKNAEAGSCEFLCDLCSKIVPRYTQHTVRTRVDNANRLLTTGTTCT